MLQDCKKLARHELNTAHDAIVDCGLTVRICF